MLRDEVREQLQRIRARLDRDRDLEGVDAIDSALLELDAASSIDSRYAEQRDDQTAEYTRTVESLRAHADRYHLLRAGELEDFVRAIAVESGEVLTAEELDAAIDRAKAEVDEPPPAESAGAVKSLLGDWAA